MLKTRKARDGEAKELLELREDQFNDLKSRDIKPASLQKTFVGFANSDGGELFVGVEDSKVRGERMAGFASPESANAVVNHLLLETRPTVEGVFAEFIDFGGHGLVLRFDIPRSVHVHYTSDGDCYIRSNASTTKITGEKVQRLLYAKGLVSFEKQLVRDLQADDIVKGKVLRNYLQRVKSTIAPLPFLQKNKLIKEDHGFLRPTVACVLLFDEDPQASLDTRCAIKVYRLETTDAQYKREHLHADPHTIEGRIESQIDEVIDWVAAVLKNVRSISDDGAVTPLRYPADALKEFLVNAVIHRDYSINDDIHVRIFDNRIEIQSPGRFPGYITRENILRERFSRNPQLVKFLHKLPNPPNKDIGEGLDHAFNAMSRAGLVAPDIEERDNSVCVTVRHKRIASIEECVLNHLRDNTNISARVAGELSGEASDEKVREVLAKMCDTGVLEQLEHTTDDEAFFCLRQAKGYPVK